MNIVNNWRHINFNKIQEKYNIEYYIYMDNLGVQMPPINFLIYE
jgi:hypothetical protein